MNEKLEMFLYFSAIIENQGLNPLKTILKSFGGWPVLEGSSWNENDFSWKDTVYKFRKHGYSVNYLIGLSIEVDMKNNSQRIIQVS